MLPWVISAAATAGVTYLGWAAMAPGSQFYGATQVRGHDPRQLALTFDDGPNDPWTPRLLDALARHEARATFFLIGSFAAQRPDLVRSIRQAGHAVGNHTWSHPNLALASSRTAYREIERCQKTLADILGEAPTLFRPPFGGRRPGALRAAHSLGLRTVMWNVTAFDWCARSSQEIEQRVLRHMGRNAGTAPIVLLHDGSHLGMGADRSLSIQAATSLLQRFHGERELVSVPELR